MTQLLAIFQELILQHSPYWDPNGMKGTLNVFSILPEPLHRAAFKMTGIDLDDPVCYLPLADNEDVIGVLAVWGKELNRDDVPAFSILANQVGIAIKDSIRYEIEARRARELDILLKASDATSSSLDLDTVLLTLAARLLELSGFQSCHISEIDPETNMAYSRAEHSRTYWRAEKQDAYSLREYPRSRQVLLTGQPLLLQGDFEAEERHWMQELGRTAVIILALPASDGSNIGLVEIASIQKGFLFPEQTLQDCQDILTRAAPGLATPLTSNDPQSLFEIEEALLKVSAAEICSISDWDHAGDRILTCAVAANLVWPSGQGPCFDPRQDTSWQLALNQEQTSSFTRTDDGMSLTSVFDGNDQMEVESLIFFPLQKGEQRIGMVELYDFNYKTRVSPEQLTLLRTMADKASYWIENARLLQEMQKRLAEQTELLNEKEILLKEIHHRVKNNLQVISSLLNLQAGQVTDPKTVEALRESQTRVRSMALIHEKLYQSHNMARIDFGEYVKSLTVELFRSYQRGLGRVELAVHIDAVELSLEQAIPCGLLLNELVTNALKYAFPHSRQGTLWVELRIESAHLLCLRVADDGVGLPQGFDYQKAESLGLKLVHSLVAQLDGELKIAQSNGTTFQVLFRN